MNEFFASIYSWFCDSANIAFSIMEQKGSVEEENLFPGYFPTIGLTAAAISLLIAFAFYIWPINHPRFKAWWAWLIMLLTNAIINFGLTYAFINQRIKSLLNENIDDITVGESLYDITDPDFSISFSEGFNLAWSNICVSIMFFIVASLIFNWFSTNCRLSPFRK